MFTEQVFLPEARDVRRAYYVKIDFLIIRQSIILEFETEKYNFYPTKKRWIVVGIS